jgi:hypothetical protein
MKPGFDTYCAAYINYFYVDDTFAGNDWEGAFQKALKESADAHSADEVRQRTKALVATLGDSYTRVLEPTAARIFDAERSGQARIGRVIDDFG